MVYKLKGTNGLIKETDTAHKGHFRVSSSLRFKTSRHGKRFIHLYETDFDLLKNKRIDQTPFILNCFPK